MNNIASPHLVNGILEKYTHLNETEMIKNFCNDVNGKVMYVKNRTIKIRSKIIHRKPMVAISPPLTKSGRIELGDLLFVLKDGTKGGTLQRATIFQVKKGKAIIRIPKHQWLLYQTIEDFKISFGNFSQYIIPRSKFSLSFLLCYQIENLVTHNRNLSNELYVKMHKNYFTLIPIPSILKALHFNRYLSSFISGKIGENLIYNVSFRLLIEKLLEFGGILHDPPEEFNKNFKEGVFGIVIFEIKEREKKYENQNI